MYCLKAGCYRSLSVSLQQRCFHVGHITLSGHNKWSKIKDKKGANDAQKSILYTKTNNEIAVAVRIGGGADPEKNTHLANIIKKAKEQGVPKDNIEKALARASGVNKVGGDPVVYEVLAANSVGVIIECFTNNINRTIHGIREILNAHNARLAPVKFMFQRQGCITLTLRNEQGSLPRHEDDLLQLCLENGVVDFSEVSGEQGPKIFRVICPPQDLGRIEAVIIGLQPTFPIEIQSAELVYLPTEVTDTTEDVANKVQQLVQSLEENEDTQRVWTTLNRH